jgi:hypothetical protein
MRRFLLAVHVSLLSISLSAFAAPERGILLRPSAAAGKENRVRQQKPKRVRVVEPDLTVLDAPALKRGEKKKVERFLTASLFDDKVVHLQLERVERDGVDSVIWSGRVEGEPLSDVSIVVKDDSLVAAISIAGDRYMIESAADGLYEAVELDPSSFPAEAEPIRPQLPPSSFASPVVTTSDSAAIIDVLVAYTDDVRTSLGSTAAAQAAASSAVAASNTAYQNSGVTARLRLVGTVEVAFAETGDLLTALEALQSTSDGKMDEVHGLRNQLGADAVVLLALSGGNGCGVAYMMSTAPSSNFAPYAFGVVANGCAVGNLSFPHELGHNFGLDHDRFVSPTGNPAYPYAFGYVDSNKQFRDIMAYVNACGSCPRLQYFSTPTLTYLSRPLGISYESAPSTSADAVRALNNAASTIANWRQAVTGAYTPATFTDNPLVAGVTVIKALHVTELRAAIDRYRTSVGQTAFAWSPATVTTGSVITAADLTQLRTALTQALPTATFTDTPANTVSVKALHIQQLRDYLD